MEEYRIEKIDGKFVCVNREDQRVEAIITALPENVVQFDKKFAYLKYNGYPLFISRAAFGGSHLDSWTCWGTTAIEVGAGAGASFLRIDWEMRGDTYEEEGSGWWTMYHCTNGSEEVDTVGEGDENATFDDLMLVIIDAYPFIDE